MAHECPECGKICHCQGDIDDIILDAESSHINCEHWKICEQEYEDDEEEGT